MACGMPWMSGSKVVQDMEQSKSLLTVTHLRKYFPVRGGLLHTVQAQVQAVDGVSFEVQRGEILGIVGESGCGKSTLARLMQRLIEPDAGEIRFAGQNTLSTSASAFKAFCRQVQMVFQDPYSSLNPRMNRASGFRLLSLQSEPRSAVRCASDVSTDATPGDCVPTPPRPIPYGRGPVHGPKTAASRDVLSSPRTPTRSSASAAGRPLWRLRSPSRLDAQG